MNKKNAARLGAGALAVALALTGCAGSGGGGDEEVTLHVFTFGFDKTTDKVFDSFTEDTGIKVVAERVASDQFPSVLQSRVSAKTDLDLINLRGGSEFNKYAEAGTFADITGAKYLGNVSKGAIQNGIFDGKSYGFSMSSYVVGVYYNKDLFDKLGISVPKNWDEFTAAATTIREKGNGVAPLVASAGDSWTNQYYYHNAIATFANENPDFMEQLKTGDATWADNPMMLTQFERFQDLVKSGDFITGAQSLKYTDAQAAFGAGKAAMWVMGSWGIGGLTPAGFTPGAFALPINDANQPTAVASSLSDNIVGATSWSKHPKEAQQLLEWLTTPAFANTFQERQGIKSTVAGIDAPYSEFQGGWDALFPDSVAFPPNVGPSVNGEGPAVIGEILAGTLTPAAALDKFQALQDSDNLTGY
ncbi:raffinose/stachyose/melibiose transport system substrate-binding protein [Cryobacterium sp. MP_M5]|uniref:ABC transporter substrate-binding protein n=1 Tax=unclassified Cryobacterium TaxID=2649013 RepID=UPI0018CBA25A|nr:MULTISPECIES: extracellular solute-binding protein [unclassified Cryobacterium]MBG6057214.1 raffinose/stachyose/melibiose transport system substrate-binding protein [Cryobacterium sp. MP_M3]MEC5175413.1 raffinose/stachyose/melibiose transport system substrate-binding protein [Cryobacterium sp. MP_M5]